MPIYVRKLKPIKKMPVVFALTSAEKARIRDIFTASLATIHSKKPDITAWYNTLFRMSHSYEVSIQEYQEQTQQEIKAVLTMVENKIKNKNTDPNWMVFSDEEYLMVLDANEAMIAMEDETNRRTQVIAIRAAKTYCSKYVG